MTSLIQHLLDTIRDHPDRTAIQGRGWVLSYRDLDAECERLSGRLQAAGVGARHVVPLLMGRSPAFVIALLAVLRRGAAYAPIDTASPPARQREIVRTLDSPVVLVDGDVDAAGLFDRPAIDVAAALNDNSVVGTQPWPLTPPEAPLYVMFTSGSTGTPKGVVVPHSGVLRLVVGADYADFRADARWAQLSSVAFDASTLEIWGALLNGACSVVQQERMPSLDAIADFLLAGRITDAWLTASLFNSIVDERIDALGGLRQLIVGGERLSPRHVQRCVEAHPRLRLINGYGPTENTTFSLCHTVTPADVSSGTDIPIGRPIAGTSIAIVGADDREVARGDAGELLVGGLGVALGYLNDADLSARRFFVRDGMRWYRTGDRVRQRADRIVEFLGRTDRQVKIQGHRIELDEVERILGQCPGVGAVVVGVDGQTSESRHLVAYYDGGGARAPAATDVLRWLEQRLPPQMVPRVLHAADRLPLNLSGKIDQQALRLLGSGAATVAAAAAAEPSTPAERALSEIWRACLPGVEVNARSHFSALGGTSILALRVAAEVRRRLGRELAPIDVLRVPVLAEQARRIEGAPSVVAEGAPAPLSATLRLSRAQSSVLLASRLDDSGCALLVHTALRLPRSIDLSGLQRAFGQLADRHPALRAVVHLDADRIGVQVRPTLPPDWWLSRGACDALPSGADWPEPLLHVLNRPLDTETAPMRVDVWSAPDGDHLLVWTVHHFALDDFSIGIALVELDALMRGQALAAVTGSAFDFAAIEDRWSDEAQIGRDARTFAEALAGRAPPLPPAPRAGAERRLELASALSTALLDRAAQWQCTPLTPLVLACGRALQATFGQAWRFLLTPFSRRLEPDLMEPIGYFLDLRLVEAGRREGEAPARALQRVHGELLAAQRPSVASVDRVAEALDAIDPSLRTSLLQFALTWRQEPERACRLGAAEARLLRVPQRAARFGLCLHLSMIDGALQAHLEAVDEAWQDGTAQRFAAAFGTALQDVLHEGHAPQPGDLARASRAAAPSADVLDLAAGNADPQVRAEIARIWTELLGHPPEGPDADFLRSGGSSIVALRLAAALRKRCGLSFEIGAFLARPSFDALCRSLHRPRPSEALPWVLVGPHVHSGYVLLVPGIGGTALGMYPLAEAMRRCLPAGVAVVLVDLNPIIERAPPTGVRPFLQAQLAQIVRDVGAAGLRAVAGYSVGGLLGADVLHELGPQQVQAVPLVLLDTYTPHALRRDVAYRTGLKLVRLMREPMHALRRAVRWRPGQREGSTSGSGGGAAAAPQWDALRREMVRSPWPQSPVAATLIKAQGTPFARGLLHRPEANGLDPAAFSSFAVHMLNTTHKDLRAKDASRAARIIADVVRRSRGPDAGVAAPAAAPRAASAEGGHDRHEPSLPMAAGAKSRP